MEVTFFLAKSKKFFLFAVFCFPKCSETTEDLFISRKNLNKINIKIHFARKFTPFLRTEFKEHLNLINIQKVNKTTAVQRTNSGEPRSFTHALPHWSQKTRTSGSTSANGNL